MPETFDIFSPVNCKVLTGRRYASEREISMVTGRVSAARARWSQTPIGERLEVCRRFVEILGARADVLAEELAWAIGRPIEQAPGELEGVRERATYMIDIAEAALSPRETTLSGTETARIGREPCAAAILIIAPWNYPYLTAINSLIPAIAAGNAVILKHSPQTPMVAENLVSAFEEAGLPAHVFQFLHATNEQTRTLIESSSVGHVVFTGSVAAGRVVNTVAARALKRATLELGGKDPAYVRQDADIESSARDIAAGAFFNSGQSCCAVERIYVDRHVESALVDALAAEAASLRLGNPLDRDTTLGPVIDKKAAERTLAQVREAERDGGRVIAPLTQRDTDLPETYLEPHLVAAAGQNTRLMQEETFGPAVGILGVDSDEEAVELMNDSAFGLTASIWTRDKKAAERIGDALVTGTWFMNRCDYLSPRLPWSGRKQSGLGCSLSELGYQELTRPKSALLKTLA